MNCDFCNKKDIQEKTQVETWFDDVWEIVWVCNDCLIELKKAMKKIRKDKKNAVR